MKLSSVQFDDKVDTVASVTLELGCDVGATGSSSLNRCRSAMTIFVLIKKSHLSDFRITNNRKGFLFFSFP